MVLGGVAVAWWIQWPLVCLFLLGAGMVARWLWQGFWWSMWHVRWEWWPRLWRDRVTPLLEDEDDRPGWISPDCRAGDHSDCEGCWCDCGHDLLPLPPERTWEQMTSHQLPLSAPQRCANCGAREGETCQAWCAYKPAGRLMTELSAPAYEAEHRAHYAAMGLDYPSGLMARVRELTP